MYPCLCARAGGGPAVPAPAACPPARPALLPGLCAVHAVRPGRAAARGPETPDQESVVRREKDGAGGNRITLSHTAGNKHQKR